MPRRGIHHQLPSAPFLDVGDADKREQEVGNTVAGREQPREFLVQSDGLDQHGREVVARHVNPGELLHGLRSRAQQESPHRARARVGGLAAEEVPPADGMLALVRGGPLNLFGLGDDPRVHDVFGFEVGDDGFGGFDFAVRDEPAGGFGEPGDGAEEDDDEDELEGEGQAP